MALRAKGYAVTLTNARDDLAKAQAYADQGYDLDEGMILMRDGQLYYGANAVTELSRILGEDRPVWRATRAAFLNKWNRRPAYWFLRSLRNLSLRLLGKKKIGRRDS